MVETKHIEGEHITANIQQHSFHRVKRFLKMESWGQENTSYCTMAHIYLYFNMYLCSTLCWFSATFYPASQMLALRFHVNQTTHSNIINYPD